MVVSFPRRGGWAVGVFAAGLTAAEFEGAWLRLQAQVLSTKAKASRIRIKLIDEFMSSSLLSCAERSH